MKRMSIAEQTLKKQIDRIDNDANKLHGEISILTARRDELFIQRRAVVVEIDRLECKRLATSKKTPDLPAKDGEANDD